MKSFEHELEAAGGVAGRVDVGMRTVPTTKIVGSVSRWRELGSDFFYRTGKGITARYYRIDSAMRRGIALPPVELYRLKKAPPAGKDRAPSSEYYVVDGHHRVAWARKLGQDFLDAHVVSYKARSSSADSSQPVPSETTEPATPIDPDSSGSGRTESSG
jgi:hypothetical protein